MPGGGGCKGQLHLRGWKRGHHKGGSTCKRRIHGPMGSKGKGVEGRHLVGNMVGLEQGPGIVYHWKGTLFHLSHLLLETRASQVSHLSNFSLFETDIMKSYKRAIS